VGPPPGRCAVAAAPRSVVPRRQAYLDGSNVEREGETSRSAAGAAPVICRAGVAVDRSIGTARRAPLPLELGPAVRRLPQLPRARAAARPAYLDAVPALQRAIRCGVGRALSDEGLATQITHWLQG